MVPERLTELVLDTMVEVLDRHVDDDLIIIYDATIGIQPELAYDQNGRWEVGCTPIMFMCMGSSDPVESNCGLMFPVQGATTEAIDHLAEQLYERLKFSLVMSDDDVLNSYAQWEQEVEAFD